MSPRGVSMLGGVRRVRCHVDQSSDSRVPRGTPRVATCHLESPRVELSTNQNLPRGSYNRRRLYLNGVAIRYLRMVVDRRGVSREVPRGPIIDRYRYHHRYGHRYGNGKCKRYRYGNKKVTVTHRNGNAYRYRNGDGDCNGDGNGNGNGR